MRKHITGEYAQFYQAEFDFRIILVELKDAVEDFVCLFLLFIFGVKHPYLAKLRFSFDIVTVYVEDVHENFVCCFVLLSVSLQDADFQELVFDLIILYVHFEKVLIHIQTAIVLP